MMYGDGMGGIWWIWIFGLLLVVGVLILLVVLVKALSGRSSNHGNTGRSRGREILDERYARGELSTEEYRERLTALEEGDR
ncbi:SHOCT domain-containing protein [Paeniglutamicibacter antarcticus]|uniref:SHOCT domain-containing protein n=1 Tax=Paeniglutamicibacter antarcticus TaxID=494023 RepID=A0ABP9TQS1_9MICC